MEQRLTIAETGFVQAVRETDEVEIPRRVEDRKLLPRDLAGVVDDALSFCTVIGRQCDATANHIQRFVRVHQKISCK